MSNTRKTFLISGISSGIGKEFLQLLQEKDQEIIPIVRKKEQVNLKDFKNVIEYDFTKPHTIIESFKELDQEIDVFVNFAGLLPGKSFQEYEHSEIQEVFDVNTISPILITQVIEKHLNPNAALIFFGSVSAQKGSYDDVYAATKGAIHSLIKSLALKLAPEKRVLGIAPSMTENTRMTEELIEGRFEHNLKTIPLRRAGKTREIAELTFFLTTDSCSFMTGSLIDINGGQYLR